MKETVEQWVKHWLLKRGINVNRVQYRVDVPQEPLAVQKVLLERMGVRRPIIFDIGANVGNITARYREMFPEAEIYSFEPFPDLSAGLQDRFSHDDLVHVVPMAVSDQEGTAEFHLTGFHTTHSLRRRKIKGRRYYPVFTASTGRSIEVPTTTLDAFCLDRGIEQVDILKFDIQGGELQALRGGIDVLSRKSVKILFTESALIQHY